MADILAPRNRAILADFAASNVLLAFDYDGTLAPIASTPAQARMRASTRRLLIEVAHRYPCVVISGRQLDDVTRRLDGIPVRYIFGNFGHEPVPDGHLPPAVILDWARHLVAHLPPNRGLVVEEKRYSVTVHYRHARNKRWALRTIARAMGELRDTRVVEGNQTVTLLPPNGPDKGIALQRARRQFHCDRALYVGDDDADEDAFASAARGNLLSIRVGTTTGKSCAHYRLRRQADIDRLLQAIRSLRATDDSAGGPDEPLRR